MHGSQTVQAMLRAKIDLLESIFACKSQVLKDRLSPFTRDVKVGKRGLCWAPGLVRFSEAVNTRPGDHRQLSPPRREQQRHIKNDVSRTRRWSLFRACGKGSQMPRPVTLGRTLRMVAVCHDARADSRSMASRTAVLSRLSSAAEFFHHAVDQTR